MPTVPASKNREKHLKIVQLFLQLRHAFRKQAGNSIRIFNRINDTTFQFFLHFSRESIMSGFGQTGDGGGGGGVGGVWVSTSK